jgi:hypothetical protein
MFAAMQRALPYPAPRKTESAWQPFDACALEPLAQPNGEFTSLFTGQELVLDAADLPRLRVEITLEARQIIGGAVLQLELMGLLFDITMTDAAYFRASYTLQWAPSPALLPNWGGLLVPGQSSATVVFPVFSAGELPQAGPLALSVRTAWLGLALHSVRVQATWAA